MYDDTYSYMFADNTTQSDIYLFTFGLLSNFTHFFGIQFLEFQMTIEIIDNKKSTIKIVNVLD